MIRKIFILMAMALAGAGAAMAQYADGAVTLDGKTGAQYKFTVITAEKKGSVAADEAVEALANVLFNQGVEGVHDGQPMLHGDNNAFLQRFMQGKVYNRYVVGRPNSSKQKINKVQQVSTDITFQVEGLYKWAAANGAKINPVWSSNNNTVKATASLNPTVVVVPVVRGERADFAAMKELMDNDPAVAYAVSEISNSFARQGYKTRDVRTALANAKTSEVMNEGVQDDIHSSVLRSLPGDIVVYADLVLTTTNRATNCMLSIEAVEKQTESKLAGRSFNSGEYMTSNKNELINYSMKKVRTDFFTDVRTAFDRMVADGRQMVLEFNLSQDVADWDFDSPTPAGDNEFIETLEEWLATNSCGGVYEIAQSSDKYVHASVNIPIWDAQKGRGYTTSNFSSALKKFLRSELGDAYKPVVTAMGQKLVVTVK